MTLTLPLEGVRIIDLTLETTGPFCTRLLADYGADVIKIEPPGGDPARALPPFADDTPGPDRSGTFLFLNTNKRSVVLDLEDDADRERLLDLVAGADAVVESFAPGRLDELGLGYERLAEVNPMVVLTSISPFGQDGPYRDWQATDFTYYAMGGPMLSTGHIDRESIRLGGRWAGYHTGYMAALATVVGVHAAELRGEGEHLDVSGFEVHTGSVDSRLTQLQAYQYSGRLSPRGALDRRRRDGRVPLRRRLRLPLGRAAGSHPGAVPDAWLRAPARAARVERAGDDLEPRAHRGVRRLHPAVDARAHEDRGARRAAGARRPRCPDLND